MKIYFENYLNENLSQKELGVIMFDVPRSGLTNSEAITKLQTAFNKADVGTVVSIDDRTLGGMYGMSSGSAYEFRKRDDGMWKEIFNDHTPVTSEQLAKMEVNSKGYQRAKR